MANSKKYITWKPKKINDFCYKHPNTDGKVNTDTAGKIIFTETSYKIADGRFISILEQHSSMSQTSFDDWKNLDLDFEFTVINEATANTLLSELGSLSVSNFVFTDNR